MTPNPQNIGAAPEEYPIRALVRSEDFGGKFNGKEIWVRRGKFPRANGRPSTYDGFDYDDLFYSEKDGWMENDYVWRPDELEILSAPQEGEALPEAKPKGPSLPEVTQPGEGVDLEAAGTWFSTMQPNATSREFGLGLIAEVRSLRATLRRESK